MTSRKAFRLVAAAALAIGLASCQEEHGFIQGGAKAQRPLKAETLKLLSQKGMRKEDPILIRVFKQDSTLEIWKRDRTGKYAFLKDYKICAWGGTVGPKIREGDKQSPEGFYAVTPWRMNPNSQYHLSFDIGYPNAFDRAFGRTGAAIMVHGACSSAGCFAMTDPQVEEIYGLAREAFAGGQSSFQVQSYPFRMTAQNMTRNRNNPNIAFWRNLKEGYDHFEVTRLEPKVDVCEKRYVFNAQPKDGLSASFTAAGACPTYEVPGHIAVAVASKRDADETEAKVAMAALEEKEKNAIERALEKKLEESKPKEESSSMVASLFGGAKASTDEAGGPPAMTPIAVPLPRPAPGRSAQPISVASIEPRGDAAPSAEPRRAAGGIGSLFGFGAKSETDSPAAIAVATPKPGAISATPAVRQIDIAKPAAPVVATPVVTASVPAPAVAAPQPAKPAKPESRSFWQRINPF